MFTFLLQKQAAIANASKIYCEIGGGTTSLSNIYFYFAPERQFGSFLFYQHYNNY